MRNPDSAINTLRTELANDADALARIAGRLQIRPEQLKALPEGNPILAATAFELHNYYCVSENLMRRVATAFENALDPGEWHKQVLARMSLNIQGVRPALIDATSRGQLDELRKFRHFFRNAYDRQLDPKKVAEILAIFSALHGAWLKAIRQFLDWLADFAARLKP